MNFNDYQKWAMSKLGGDHPEFACALGLAGEAGETVDMLKKHWCHGKPLDTEKLAKELGDVLYYLAALSGVMGIDFNKVMEMNVDKLNARYPGGFSKEAAAKRADESK